MGRFGRRKCQSSPRPVFFSPTGGSPRRGSGVSAHSRRVVRQVPDRPGRPGDLDRVIATRLWDETYRVNVFCTTGLGVTKATRITGSFFVATSDRKSVV